MTIEEKIKQAIEILDDIEGEARDTRCTTNNNAYWHIENAVGTAREAFDDLEEEITWNHGIARIKED